MSSAEHEIHIQHDESTGLFAIVALHDRKSEISFGGCRCLPYSSPHAAIDDALRLAKAMRQKSLICGMNYGGAKAVVMRPAKIENRQAYFRSFGRFVADLKGRFITGCDSGVTIDDMRSALSVCEYITACDEEAEKEDHLSTLTAFGVRCAMESIVLAHLKKPSLKGLHVAIQGVGKVGYALAKALKAEGAHLTITDLDMTRCRSAARLLGAKYVLPDMIYDIPCDLFSPCALGGVINRKTIERLHTPIICGCANNQLQEGEVAELLHEKGITYVPDFLCNSGGFIYAVESYFGGSASSAKEKILKTIPQRVREIYALGVDSKSSLERVIKKIVRR